MKLLGAQNQAVSGCGGEYFPVRTGYLLPRTVLQDPVVAPAGSVLRVWLTQALDFWARPTRRPLNWEAGMAPVGWKAVTVFGRNVCESSGSKVVPNLVRVQR